MSKTLERIRALVAADQVRVTRHGYDEMQHDDIRIRDVRNGLDSAVEVEDYPDYAKGPCVLVLQHDHEGKPIHVLWGIARGTDGPAAVITAYRPAPDRWSDDFKERLQ